MCLEVPPLHAPLVAHLMAWKPTAALGEPRIHALAQELLSKVLRHSPLQTEAWQFDGVKGLRRELKRIPIAYLSSHILEHAGKRVKEEGAHKIITQGLRLAMTAQGISALSVAIAKPRTARDEALLQREIEILKCCAQEDCSGMIRLIDKVEYVKGERRKTRMILPWYAEGNLLQTFTRLSNEEKFSICHQLFQIVEGLEAKGWVYRDLKGGNLLISDWGGRVQVTLCDAGAMHKCGLGSAPQLMGSRAFMAPEYAYIATESCPELHNSLVLQFTTSKLDVWGCGVLVAGLLLPDVYQKLFLEEQQPEESISQAARWYREQRIPVLEALDPSSLWHRFLQGVLAPCPDRRLSPAEALSQFEALFVVGRPPADGDGSVDLLEEKESGHLVGKGHRGQREFACRSSK